MSENTIDQLSILINNILATENDDELNCVLYNLDSLRNSMACSWKPFL